MFCGVEASRSTICGSFTVKPIETIAVHVTIDTERNGVSQRTCSNGAVEESTVRTGWLTGAGGDCDCSWASSADSDL